MRAYEKTHPWISFTADLSKAPWDFWVVLGECQSKCQHIANVPLRPQTAEKLYTIYLAKGARASAAIEGNTLDEEQVRQQLEGRLHLPPSREYLGREVHNIVAACQVVTDEIASGNIPRFTRRRITQLNADLLKDVPIASGAVPGEISDYVVGVARYRGAPREDCGYLLERLSKWIDGPDLGAPRPDVQICFAIIRAVLAHLYLEWIHPFGDGNGRTGRLLEFQILIGSGVPAPAAHLLSNHYNSTRNEYYRQLDAASKSGGDVVPFLRYAAEGMLDGLKEQLELIWKQQWDIAWRNYVHEHEEFRDKTSGVVRRRRRLVLDLSRSPKPVPFEGLLELSPRVAGYYAQLAPRTLTRDLKDLRRIGMIERTASGYRARKELILAFRPPRAADSDAGE